MVGKTGSLGESKWQEVLLLTITKSATSHTTYSFCCGKRACHTSGLLGLQTRGGAAGRNGDTPHLIGLGVIGCLSILGLLDVLHHLPEEGVTVVLVLCHQHLQHEPQAPEMGVRSIIVSVM